MILRPPDPPVALTSPDFPCPRLNRAFLLSPEKHGKSGGDFMNEDSRTETFSKKIEVIKYRLFISRISFHPS